MSVIETYLSRFAESEARIGEGWSRRYEHVVAIPCVDERAELVHGLVAAARAAPGRVLAIVVVNRTHSATAQVREANHQLMAALWQMHRPSCGESSTVPVEIADEPRAFLCELGAFDLLVVDRTTEPWCLPDDQGVGLARKIGVDIGLALRARGWIGSPWLHLTDADVELPDDYFGAAEGIAAAALVYPFWHVVDDTWQGRALALYDLSLRYHLLGLRWARSPYAFHTVGSAVAVADRAYAAVRGVPRRQAAEDFYLLNKVAKVGPVVEAPSSPIRIRQRTSSRVPFGTGAATARITRTLETGAEFCLDHPHCFALLRQVEEALAEVSHRAEPEWDPPVEPFATSLGLSRAVSEARARTAGPDALRRRIHEWFDAFRTLKLVHAVRDAGSPPLPWREALAGAPFLSGTLDPDDGVGDLRTRLFELEQGIGPTARPAPPRTIGA